MSVIPAEIKKLFNFQHDSRGKKAKKNIILIFLLHGFNFLSLLLLVPLSIDYLGEVKYGIWVTLSSVVMWVGNFDFGIGNGLRNKLAEAFAQNDFNKAKKFTSTAYFVFGKIVLLIIVIFICTAWLINWTKVFNAPVNLNDELETAVYYVFILYAILFFARLISSVINADQKPALNSFLGVLGNILTLVAVYFLFKTTSGSLTLIGIVSFAILLLVFVIASVILFKGIYKKISPSIKYIDKNSSKDLVNLGFKFFIIQLSGLVLFATGNLIISQLLGPEHVTVYNVAYRYFYFIPLVFNVVLAPFWSAYTDAYAKNEIDWIKKSVKKILLIWGILSTVVVLMIFVSGTVYRIWVGQNIEVPFLLSVLMGLFVIISNWNNIFTYFLNGVGKIQLQFYSSIFTAIINIPLSIFLVKNLELGLSGVILSTCICLFIGSIWAPLQYHKIISKTAKGIWDK